MIASLIFIIVLVLADQGIKMLATTYLMGTHPVTVIPGVLGLRYIKNTGAAFSMFSNGTTMLIIVTAIALGVIAYFLFIKKAGTSIERFCFYLIFAGGLGNLIDRVFQGFVVDYFEFLFMEFAVFNFADVLICVGVGIFAIYTVYMELIAKKGIKHE